MNKHDLIIIPYHFHVLSFSFVAQVSSIYADASIGNSIKIAVVHIMYVEHDLVPDASSGNGKSERMLFPLLSFSRRFRRRIFFPQNTVKMLLNEDSLYII
jgi:hypothetical protein